MATASTITSLLLPDSAVSGQDAKCPGVRATGFQIGQRGEPVPSPSFELGVQVDIIGMLRPKRPEKDLQRLTISLKTNGLTSRRSNGVDWKRPRPISQPLDLDAREPAQNSEVEELSEQISYPDVSHPSVEKRLAKPDVNTVSNPVLARLIEEVRYENTDGPHAYNRMHNRHNRSR
jgi:hypothetical protein